MSEMKASDLTAEERAIVEEMVTRTCVHWGYIATPDGNFGGWLMEGEYREAYESAMRRILARRALFSPALPGTKP